ncbi:MAG TPA: ABC-F family ATP-binding cassette domain-containing protein [Candidatus Binatia bacterium]|jgi:ATP-binding cassette subfamily F protein 3
MSLVVMEDCELAFGGRSIFSGLNLRIGEEDRIGLVGRNGSGKSSLLRVLVGQQEMDRGAVRRAGAIRIGYLPQELEVAGGRSLVDSVLSSVPGRAALESTLELVEHELAEATTEAEQMELAEKLATLHDDVAHFDSNYSPHEAHRILDGLGFRSGDATRDLGEFSGGWKMRAVMASLLFQKPDLLLMDEPTNHLDVTTVGWLADFLRRYRNAMILICHDRDFLNEQVTRIVSYEPEGVRQYSGNYEDYKRQRAEEAEILERRAVNQQRLRDQTERFIARFRAQANKAAAVQSRVKMLGKLEDVNLLGSERTLRFRFPPCQRAGVDTVILGDLGHRYGEIDVFEHAEGIVRRGDKVAIIGPNGAGKTTLLRILAGEIAPAAGGFRLGHNVKVGYYAQHVTERLDLRNSVFDEVWQNSAYDDLTQVRNVLGTFLFSDDDVDKKIAVLSGGEKARVALARLMVDPGNLLLMDEPTNHLDLESSEALAEALATYDGTLIFVSHNRSFVRHLATRVWYVHEHVVEEFPGTMDEFLYHLAQQRSGAEKTARAEAKAEKAEAKAGKAAANAGKAAATAVKTGAKGDRQAANADTQLRKLEAPSAMPPAAAPVDPRGAKDEKARERAKDREAQRTLRDLEKRVQEYEARIAEIETLQAGRSNELSQPEIYADQQRYGSLLSAYTEDQKKLEELMLRWEQAQASLAEIRG